MTATFQSTMRSARCKCPRGSRSICKRSVVRWKGRFATTRYGWAGSATRVASLVTTRTFSQRPSSARANEASTSIAMTRSATCARCLVSRPLPAPRSSTRSPRAISASRTSSRARASLRRKCWLRGADRRARCGRRPATEAASGVGGHSVEFTSDSAKPAAGRASGSRSRTRPHGCGESHELPAPCACFRLDNSLRPVDRTSGVGDNMGTYVPFSLHGSRCCSCWTSPVPTA